MQRFKYKKYFVIALSLVFMGFFIRERNLVLRSAPKVTVDELRQSDCGVVLTGSAGRIREAFEVMSQKKISKLIISGVYKDTKLSEIFAQLPDFSRIRSEDIILEKKSGSTHQNAVQSLILVQDLKCQNILLITSELHMHRAFKTFKAYFPETIEIRPYPIVNPTKQDSELSIQYEVFKSLFYFIASFV